MPSRLPLRRRNGNPGATRLPSGLLCPRQLPTVPHYPHAVTPSTPFHAVPQDDWIAANGTGFAIWDRFPVNPGHALVVPHREVTRWWDLSAEEQAKLLALAGLVRREVEARHAPDGYNIGFNDGEAAGQTVDQFHLHVIPRYAGDVPDPRGGIRHVIPDRGNYLAGPTTPTSPP